MSPTISFRAVQRALTRLCTISISMTREVDYFFKAGINFTTRSTYCVYWITFTRTISFLIEYVNYYDAIPDSVGFRERIIKNKTLRKPVKTQTNYGPSVINTKRLLIVPLNDPSKRIRIRGRRISHDLCTGYYFRGQSARASVLLY